MKLAAISASLALVVVATVPASAVAARLHAERSFTIALNAPADAATTAFGPIEEQRWSPEWRPEFAYPEDPKSVEGAVFTIRRDGRRQVWRVETWDMERHVVRYTAVDPEHTFTRFSIQVLAVDPTHSRATITSERTALSEAGDEEVAHFAAHFASQAPHWEATLNAYLAGGAKH